MIEKFPNHSAVELQITLDSEVVYPKNITEDDFLHEIQSNSKLHWYVNPFVLAEDRVRILLDPPEFNRWKTKKRVCEVVLTLIIIWGFKTWTYDMLLLLLIIPFTILALPHFWFILFMTIAITVKFYFSFTIPFFWVIILLVGISYSITKSSDDRAKQAIIRQALNNWQTFWKYYSNRIIYPISISDSDEFTNLKQRFPELA